MGFAWMVKGCRVELNKLHVLYGSLCTVYHSLAIASSDNRVCCGLINGSATTSAHHGNLTQISVNLLSFRVEDVSSIAINIWSATSNACAKMMLSDNLYCKMVFLDFNIRIALHSLHKSTLNLSSCVVGMMKNTELRMSALAMKVERAIFLAVEVYTPTH